MSLSLHAVNLALRNRARSVVVATTGSITLSASATGYARASGSFLDDNFAVGMEVTALGFTGEQTLVTDTGDTLVTDTGLALVTDSFSLPDLADTLRVITGVTALTMTVAGTVGVDAAAAGRTLSVLLPSQRAWENVVLNPVAGFPYVEEDFVPATSTLFTAQAANGEVEDTGLYILKVYCQSGVGAAALRKYADALRLLYAPGTSLAAGSNYVRTRGDQGPQTGQIIPLSGGRAAIVLTVQWFAYHQNAIAA